MFKESLPSTPIDSQHNVLGNLDKESAKLLNQSHSWHNVFYEEIIRVFPERLFSVLYASKMGRPNYPVRFLVGMLILKEAHDWTDEQLFEQIRFNLKVRWALGFRNLTDVIPSTSTYYAFKWSLYDHAERTGEDLLEKAFEQISWQQIEKYKISGKDFRMDSKLYNSNIATGSLARVLCETLKVFIRDLSAVEYETIDKGFSDLLVQITNKSSDGVTYQMTKAAKTAFITSCGELLLHLSTLFTGHPSKNYALIERVLEEQFDLITPQSNENEGLSTPLPITTQLKDRKEVNGSTLQSPHDADASYRKKKNGDHIQQIRGFVSNIGETCAKDNPFNLINTVTTATVTTVDNDFVEKSIHQAQRVSGSIEYSWQDGAYSSALNRHFFEQENIIAYFPALSGKDTFHQFEWKVNPEDTDDQLLIVTDTRDGTIYTATKGTDTKGNIRYRIIYNHPRKDGRTNYRYFSPQEIENYFKRRAIDQIPQEILDRRNNVEATIWQVFCKLRKKTRYRGLLRNHYMVLGRCFWVNCQRITLFLTRKHLKQAFCTIFKVKNDNYLLNLCNQIVLNVFRVT